MLKKIFQELYQSFKLPEFQTVWIQIMTDRTSDTDHDRQNVGPDLDPNCLQMLSAATEVASSKGQYSKSLVHICKIGCEIIG